LLDAAGAIVTDSGAVQDEAAALGVSCFTLGATTARPVTLTHGRNLLLGDAPEAIGEVRLPRAVSQRTSIPLWEGDAARRIAAVLIANYTLATSLVGA
jgi:UDP-N-acetylglucosamine 2-epimerase (non-hydrolysing)